MRFASGVCLLIAFSGCAYDWDALRGGSGPNNMGCDAYPDALFCSGFETGDLSDWSIPGFGDTPVIIENAAAGSYAAKVETPGNGSAGFVDAQVNFIANGGGKFYGRAYYYLPSEVDVSHFEPLEAFPSPAEQVFAILILDDERVSLWVNSADEVVTGDVTFPRDRWFCLRFAAELSNPGSVQLWVDDALSVDATGDFAASGVEFMSMPARYTHDQAPYEQGPVEIWFDEVVFDDEPVGCN